MVFLLGILIGLPFAACEQRKGEESEDVSARRSISAGISEKSGRKADHIVVTYQTFEPDSILTDFKEVADAINAITVPEIGVEAEFRQIGAVEAFTEYSLWISRGEQIDLMMLNYQDITAYINRGMLLPIDACLEQEGQGIAELVEEGLNPMEGSVAEGKTYGVVTVTRGQGNGSGIWTRKEYLEEAGISYQTGHVYTFDELTEIFGKFKALYPDKYPLGQITSGQTGSSASFYLRSGDGLGGDVMGGMILGDDFQVVSYYGSEQYEEFLRYMRKWYLNGYIYPDAAFTDTSQVELIKEEVLMSYPSSSAPGMAPKDWMKGETVCLRTMKPEIGAQYARSGFWTIPVTSAEPEAAMRFLNMMYTDARIGNLLSLGIEGKHYVVTDEEHKLADYPEGKDSSTVGYLNPLGMYGDYRKQYMRGTVEDREAESAYSEEAARNTVYTITRGMYYSTANVSKELADLQETVLKYVPILESGSVDIDKYYPEFLNELDRAGLQKVMEDKQRQLNEWLSVREQK